MKHRLPTLILVLSFSSCVSTTPSEPVERNLTSEDLPEGPAPDKGTIGSECDDDFECESLYCYFELEAEIGVCTLACELDSDICPDGYLCQDSDEGPLCLSGENDENCGNLDLDNGEECDGEEGCTPECTWADVMAGQEMAGQEMAGQEMAGQEPAGQEPAGQEPAGQEPAGQEPAGQEPAGQEPAGDQGPFCGDGVRNGDEECDGTDNCNPDCTIVRPPPPVCGNNQQEEGEECDGGNDCSLNCQSFRGGDGPDRLIGDERDNLMRGRPGDDVMRGRGGDDDMQGGEGNDDINGEEGNDLLKGNENDDLLRGGPGDDIIEGGIGNDTLRGGSGNDHLYGGRGDDTYNYTLGDEVIHIYPNGNGNDRLWCRGGARVRRVDREDENVRLLMEPTGRIVLHDQTTNQGTTVDVIDCPGYE